MLQRRGSESLVSIIQRAQALDQQDERHKQERRADANSTKSSNSSSNNNTLDNEAVSAASFYVPALPAASSSNLVLAPMYSGHLPAAYPLDAQSRDIMPDDAESDAHLFFVSKF